MSDKSPLFVSALELLAHATELYATGDTKKYKFVILHLANSIELILKDCLIDHGVSIYKNPKETITIWGTFDELEKLKIHTPEKPVIELLIDDRNTIQHRFGFPNADAVFYYLEQVITFFSRFLEEQYKVNLSEALGSHLSKEHLALIGLVKDDYTHLRKLFQLSPEAAIQQAYTMIEGKLRELTLNNAPNDQKNKNRPILAQEYMSILVNKGVISSELINSIHQIRNARNVAAHAVAIDPDAMDWDDFLKAAINILDKLDKIEIVSDQVSTNQDKTIG